MAETAAAQVGHSIALLAPTSKRTTRPQLRLLCAVVSGGQTGADIGSLRAARKVGLATGGFAPLGWKTLDGPAPWLGTDFGLTECQDQHYPARTARNVFNSDATLRIASDFCSTGEQCTLRAIKRYKKPRLDLKREDLEDQHTRMQAIFELVEWLAEKNVRVLNVAGNSNTTSPGIEELVEDFLVEALGDCQ